MHAKDALGRDGEQTAAAYLEGRGFRILDRNWRCADGEIDIVAVERQMFVVCEVKTRSWTRYGTLLEVAGRVKRARLLPDTALREARDRIRAAIVLPQVNVLKF